MKKQLFTQPGAYSLLLAFGWTFVMAIFLLAALSGMKKEIESSARSVARAYIDKDIQFREWVAMHGGVYVPITKDTQPNSYLLPSLVPERDIKTPANREMTLVNPAYMTRQLYELAMKEKHIAGHITSLKPLRPENRPDGWETGALQAFEKGTTEFSTIVVENGTRSLRLMKPLLTEEGCLHCHNHQGYKKGDIRGGISVKLPMTLFETTLSRQTRLIWTGHGAIWLAGMAGLFAGYVGLRRRTKERDKAEEELYRANALLQGQATTDFLTGLYNRRKFLELLHKERGEALRYNMPLALIFFDIDHFKAINDTYGHKTGDLVLKEISHLVTKSIRQTDIFARFGGEEFIILVHNNDVNTGRDLAEKIRKTVAKRQFPDAVTVTCSFGVAQLHPDDTAEVLIHKADEAMYTAKQHGRNCVETWQGSPSA